MATISDIAAKAGVSQALVSRVLNQKSGVSPANRAKILAVMEELNYRPNTLARSLVLQRTQTIGVVMDTLCHPFFFQMIYGLQDAGERLGYNIVFCSGRSDARIKSKYIDYFGSGRADGLIVYGSHLNDQSVLNDLALRNTSFVLIEGTLPGVAVNNLLVDNFQGAQRATEHLIQSGYRRIAHFTGDMEYKVAQDRLRGYQAAMEQAGLPATVVSTVFSEQSGYEAMTSLIQSGNIPEAIFFGADRIAFGAIRAMGRHGLKTPEDIAIIGFDDDAPQEPDGQYPKLSTLRQPLYQMGLDSVELLAQTIENPHKERVVMVYEPELVLRDTCK